MKRQERSRRFSRLGPLEHLETRALMTMTAAATPLPNMDISMGANPPAMELNAYFKDSAPAANFALVNTTLGTIPVLLTPQAAPTTVSSFLNNVNKGDYTSSLVSRSVPGVLWQAGGYQLGTNSNIKATTDSTPAKAEAGAADTRGTIAMVNSGTTAGSGGQFFFNEGDNSSSPAAQTAGSTVFGHVVGSQGLAVMDAIAAVPVPKTSPLAAPLNQTPLQHYTPGQPVQVVNLNLINNITTASQYYETVSDASNVATATITGGELKITPVSIGTAHVAVVAYGADGSSAVETFTVNVDGYPSAVSQPATSTTPAPTPPTATLATPAPLSSLLIPEATGNLPTSAVAGQKTRIEQRVSLTSPSLAVKQLERVTLSLARIGITPAYTIATGSTDVQLKVGQQTKLNLSASRIPASVPAGSYHLLVTVTDPGGPATTVDSGETLIVKAPQAKSTLK